MKSSRTKKNSRGSQLCFEDSMCAPAVGAHYLPIPFTHARYSNARIRSPRSPSFLSFAVVPSFAKRRRLVPFFVTFQNLQRKPNCDRHGLMKVFSFIPCQHHSWHGHMDMTGTIAVHVFFLPISPQPQPQRKEPREVLFLSCFAAFSNSTNKKKLFLFAPVHR